MERGFARLVACDCQDQESVPLFTHCGHSSLFVSMYLLFKIACGGFSMTALTSSGHVWMWGSVQGGWNGGKQSPRQITSLSPYKIVHVSSGRTHCLTLSECGKVFFWTDESDVQEIEIKIKDDEENGTFPIVAQIASGWGHFSILTTTGSIYSMNVEEYSSRLVDFMQVITPEDKVIQIAAGDRSTYYLTSLGAVYIIHNPDQEDNNNSRVPVRIEIPNTPKISNISASFLNAAFMDENQVYTYSLDRKRVTVHEQLARKDMQTVSGATRSVGFIQAAFGDWHYGAINEEGEVSSNKSII